MPASMLPKRLPIICIAKSSELPKPPACGTDPDRPVDLGVQTGDRFEATHLQLWVFI